MQNKDTKKEFTLVSSHNRQEFKFKTLKQKAFYVKTCIKWWIALLWTQNTSGQYLVSGLDIVVCWKQKGGDEVEAQ